MQTPIGKKRTERVRRKRQIRVFPQVTRWGGRNLQVVLGVQRPTVDDLLRRDNPFPTLLGGHGPQMVRVNLNGRTIAQGYLIDRQHAPVVDPEDSVNPAVAADASITDFQRFNGDPTRVGQNRGPIRMPLSTPWLTVECNHLRVTHFGRGFGVPEPIKIVLFRVGHGIVRFDRRFLASCQGRLPFRVA